MQIILFLHQVVTLSTALIMVAAFVFGVLTVIRHLRLKQKDVAILSGTSMAQRTKQHQRLLKWGFGFLTAGLLTGLVLMFEAKGSLALTVHIFMAVGAWGLYGFFLRKQSLPWQGMRLIALSLLGCFVLTIIFLQHHVR